MNFLKNGAALLFGGLSFWAPTVGVELITRRELNPVVGTILPPAAVMCAYLLLQRTRPGLFTSWTSIRMLAGIYVLGPAMMLIAWTYRGTSSDLEPVNLVIASFVPIFALYMAGPDVTFFGVVIATVALIWTHFALDRKRLASALNEKGNGVSGLRGTGIPSDAIGAKSAT